MCHNSSSSSAAAAAGFRLFYWPVRSSSFQILAVEVKTVLSIFYIGVVGSTWVSGIVG
jgi:hypothetical protein